MALFKELYFFGVIEPGFVSQAEFQPAEFHAKVLDNYVIGCADTVVVYRNMIFLARRTNEPCKGKFFFMGGRMIPGQTPEQAISHQIRKELGKTFSPDRFIPLCVNYEIRKTRAQPSKENGACFISYVFALFLNKDERWGFMLNNEFDESIWIKPRVIINSPDNYDQTVIQVAHKVQRLIRWRLLKKLFLLE